MSSTGLSSLIVKKESTVATAVTPTHPIRYKGGDIMLKRETKKNNPIQNNRANNIQALPGKINSEGSYSFDLDFNEAGFWFMAGLGTLTSSTDVSSGTDASVLKHQFDISNSLTSLTVQQQKGDITDTSNNRQNYLVSRAFGVLVESMKLSAKDEEIQLGVDVKAHGIFERALMIDNAAAGSSVAIKLDTVEGLTTSDTVNTYDATPQNESDAVASISATAKTVTIATLGNSYTVANKGKVELVPITPSYSLAPHVPMFHHANFQFGADLTAAASATEDNIEDWTLEHKNNLDVRYGSIRQTPSKVTAKRYDTTFEYTKYFDNVADRDNYLALTQRAIILTITDNVIVSATDTGTLKYKIEVKIPDFRIDSFELPTEVDGVYAAVVKGSCYYDSSAGYALRISVWNALAGTAYSA